MLLSITECMTQMLEQDNADIELISQLITKRQEIIDELSMQDNITTNDEELKNIFRKIYEEDIKNTKKIEQLLEDNLQNIKKISNSKKQISYFPKTDYSEGFFIDKRE